MSIWSPGIDMPKSSATEQSAFKEYRKKPVVIQAIEVTRKNMAAIEQELNRNVCAYTTMIDERTGDPSVSIVTLEGRMIANAGDFIIRGVKGEYYLCKPDIFAATYEEVR